MQEVWRSAFRISYRQVDSYQVGRVFHAGDAAHVHSPVGARGMNLGIEDGTVLAARSRRAGSRAIPRNVIRSGRA
jgi:2-polyprenyl-6-methoxyphenol hydroxylase-like FAD-dependent oxidoreductase